MKFRYLPIQETQTDDVVQFYRSTKTAYFTNNNFYVTRKPYDPTGYSTGDDPGTISVKFDDCRDKNGWAEDYFKLVATKPGLEAKVGDLCIMIQDHPNIKGPKCNTVFRVTSLSSNDYILSDIPAPTGNPTWIIRRSLCSVLIPHSQRISRTKQLKDANATTSN